MEKKENKIKIALSTENNKTFNKNKNNFKFSLIWPLKVLVLTFFFSVGFSIFSQIINSKVGIIISVLIIITFLVIGVIFDIIGVSATVCGKDIFLALSKGGDRAASVAYSLVLNSEKVSSFCCDIIGDICGVLSGSAGASLLVKINLSLSNAGEILLSTTISAIIASLTVFFKALGKTFAIEKSHSIIYKFSKFLSFFTRGRKNEGKQAK